MSMDLKVRLGKCFCGHGRRNETHHGMGVLCSSQRGRSLINLGIVEKVEGQVKGRFMKARPKRREGSKNVGVQESARAVVAESNNKNVALV